MFAIFGWLLPGGRLGLARRFGLGWVGLRITSCHAGLAHSFEFKVVALDTEVMAPADQGNEPF